MEDVIDDQKKETITDILAVGVDGTKEYIDWIIVGDKMGFRVFGIECWCWTLLVYK